MIQGRCRIDEMHGSVKRVNNSRGDVHGPVRKDQRHQASRAQIKQHETDHAGEKRYKAIGEIAPVGNERERTMLRGPAKADDKHSRPGSSGERFQAGEAVGLVGRFLGWRPENPPDRKTVQHGPEWRGMRMDKISVEA